VAPAFAALEFSGVAAKPLEARQQGEKTKNAKARRAPQTGEAQAGRKAGKPIQVPTESSETSAGAWVGLPTIWNPEWQSDLSEKMEGHAGIHTVKGMVV